MRLLAVMVLVGQVGYCHVFSLLFLFSKTITMSNLKPLVMSADCPLVLEVSSSYPSFAFAGLGSKIIGHVSVPLRRQAFVNIALSLFLSCRSIH